LRKTDKHVLDYYMQPKKKEGRQAPFFLSEKYSREGPHCERRQVP
jgi:hypothetical protein